MHRSTLCRHIHNIHLTQHMKQPYGDFGVVNKQLLRFSSGPYKTKETSYILQLAAATLGVTATCGLYSYFQGNKSLWDAVHSLSISNVLQPKNRVLQYSLDEVAKHCNRKTGIWVSYDCAVYDITNYVEQHPGGDKIFMAAGGPLEPFFIMYPIHKQPFVLAHLEEYKIGTLEDCEETGTTSSANNQHGDMPRTRLPPNKGIPDIDPVTYTLQIDGVDTTPTKLTLHTLKNNFKKHTITASVKCAGNCRTENDEVKAIKWTGARLVDVLKAVGYREDHAGAKYVQFQGLDLAVPDMHYATSISFANATDPTNNILLAYEMDGQPLSKAHGFPIRVVMPGVPGGRQVKWLGRIVISRGENDSS